MPYSIREWRTARSLETWKQQSLDTLGYYVEPWELIRPRPSRIWPQGPHLHQAAAYLAAIGTTEMEDPIAIEVVLVQTANEAPREVTIQVGRPFEDPDYPGEWLCPVSLEPLYPNLRPARSNSPFHSLCLANSLVLNLLYLIVEKGGSVWLEPGSPFPFEAYAPVIRLRGGPERNHS